jgi:hypothetical protein
MIATRLNQAIYTLLVVCNLIISGRGVDFPYVTRLVNLTYLHHAVRQGAGQVLHILTFLCVFQLPFIVSSNCIFDLE